MSPKLLVLLVVLGIVYFTLSQTTDEEGVENDHGLSLVVSIVRHGDRTPLQIFKNTPSQWPEGLGELTSLGMRQHYSLGSEYRKRYIEEMKLIESYYNRTDFYAQSTAKHRSLMSADSFVLGLFPPGTGPKYDNEYVLPNGLQAVPIFSDLNEDDYLLYSHKLCKKAKHLRKTFQNGGEWARLEEKHSQLIHELSLILGEQITLGDISSLVTLLNAERIHSRPTLDTLASNTTLMSTIRHLQKDILKLKYGTQEIGRLSSGNLLRNVLHRIEKKHQGDHSEAKFVLFSGHDSNLLAIFSALDLIYSVEVPYYADHVTFEYFKPQNSEEGVVKMLYNFQELHIPGCTSTACPLSEFKKVILSKTSDDIRRECELHSHHRDEL